MKKSKIALIAALIAVLTAVGYGVASTTSNTQTAETQAKATIDAQSQAKATEAIAQSEAVIQKTKELAYSQDVKNGTKEMLSAMGQMLPILDNYTPSKAQDLASSMLEVSAKVQKVASIKPPSGYEHVQILYKQGADSLVKSMAALAVGLDKGDSSVVKQSMNEMNQSELALKQAMDEMNSILTSHGISY